jgi:uridine kinase
MLLRVPDRHAPDKLARFEPQPKTYEVFRESLRWNAIMNLDNVGDVNHACQKGRATELIQVAEALQEKKIVQIAEEINRRYQDGNLRLVLITGPSSSGKTTVAKRLSIQLMACGLKPLTVSTDDYFVNRLDTPRLPDGSFDFDNFDTVDHEAMQNDLIKLLGGEEVQVPEDFYGNEIRLKMQVRDGMAAYAAWINGSWKVIGEPMPLTKGGWVGARPGIYCAGTRGQWGGHVDVKEVIVTDTENHRI